jgi:hypothetical protein
MEEAYVIGRTAEEGLTSLAQIVQSGETEPVIDMYERAAWAYGASPKETQTVIKESRKAYRALECCVCGAHTMGRQWWNRDIGYGICSPCVQFVRKHGETEVDIRSNYGIEGIHYAAHC